MSETASQALRRAQRCSQLGRAEGQDPSPSPAAGESQGGAGRRGDSAAPGRGTCRRKGSPRPTLSTPREPRSSWGDQPWVRAPTGLPHWGLRVWPCGPRMASPSAAPWSAPQLEWPPLALQSGDEWIHLCLAKAGPPREAELLLPDASWLSDVLQRDRGSETGTSRLESPSGHFPILSPVPSLPVFVHLPSPDRKSVV